MLYSVDNITVWDALHHLDLSEDPIIQSSGFCGCRFEAVVGPDPPSPPTVSCLDPSNGDDGLDLQRQFYQKDFVFWSLYSIHTKLYSLFEKIIFFSHSFLNTSSLTPWRMCTIKLTKSVHVSDSDHIYFGWCQDALLDLRWTRIN